MRKLFIFILIFTCFALFGQGTNVMHTTHRVISTGATPSPSEMLSQNDFASVTNWTLGVGFSHDAVNDEVDYDATSSNMYQLDGAMLSSIQGSTDYTFEVTITATSFKCDINLFDSGGTEYYNCTVSNTGTGTFSVDFTTPPGIGNGGLMILGGAFTYTMSSVSLKER